MIEPRRAVPGPALRIPLLLALAASALCLLAAAHRDFWAPDEPDFAEHAREMIERRDFLIPYQNGAPYSEKPPLFYWAMIATTPLSGFDVHPVATRLPSALAAGAMVFGAAWLAGRRGGKAEALLAGAMTATAPILWWQGQFLQIDAFFSALVVLGYLAEFGVWHDPAHAGRWRLALHLLIPAGILAKGPLTLALLGLVALVECVRERSWRPIAALGPVRGAALTLLLVIPWYVAASVHGGRAYAYDLIVNQNWNRFLHAFDHVQPWWFYLESVWGDFSPWTLPALGAVVLLARRSLFRERPELRFSATVFATAFVFLSASQAKQGKYLLMAYPFAAVLAAAGVADGDREARAGARGPSLPFFRACALLAGFLLLAAAVVVPGAAARRYPEYAALGPWLAAPLAVGAAGTLAVLMLRRREAAPAFLALAATVAAGEAAAGAGLFPALDERKTGRGFYERLAPEFAHGEPLAYYGEPYRCYPILVMRRKTAHPKTESDLVAWLAAEPRGKVLVTEEHRGAWRNPFLRSLVVLEKASVGQGNVVLLGQP